MRLCSLCVFRSQQYYYYTNIEPLLLIDIITTYGTTYHIWYLMLVRPIKIALPILVLCTEFARYTHVHSVTVNNCVVLVTNIR